MASIICGSVAIRNATFSKVQKFVFGSIPSLGFKRTVKGEVKKSSFFNSLGTSANAFNISKSFTIKEKYFAGLRFFKCLRFLRPLKSSARTPNPKLVSVG